MTFVCVCYSSWDVHDFFVLSGWDIYDLFYLELLGLFTAFKCYIGGDVDYFFGVC